MGKDTFPFYHSTIHFSHAFLKLSFLEGCDQFVEVQFVYVQGQIAFGRSFSTRRALLLIDGQTWVVKVTSPSFTSTCLGMCRGELSRHRREITFEVWSLHYLYYRVIHFAFPFHDPSHSPSLYLLIFLKVINTIVILLKILYTHFTNINNIGFLVLLYWKFRRKMCYVF